MVIRRQLARLVGIEHVAVGFLVLRNGLVEIIPNPIPFGIWSLFLLVVGVKNYKRLEIKKDSIQKRD